jgi:UDPglucose 6-dehydrogenase
MRTNTRQRHRVVEKVADRVGGLGGAVVAVWGLTFKAGTDDLRDSPALDIVARFLEAGAVVRAHDPAGGARAALLVPGLDVVDDPYLACKEADILVVLTEWDDFRGLDFARIHRAMAVPQVLDTRNVLDGARLRGLGFAYEGTGRR